MVLFVKCLEAKYEGCINEYFSSLQKMCLGEELQSRVFLPIIHRYKTGNYGLNIDTIIILVCVATG